MELRRRTTRINSETFSECPPERSEGSLSLQHSPKTAEILRFAQNDTIQKRGFRVGPKIFDPYKTGE